MPRPHLEYSAITDQILVGTNLCCREHFAKLLELGVAADIDLERERQDFGKPEGLECHLWLPVEDGAAPTPLQLEVGVAVIDRFVQSGRRVYVHCRNGHGRSPTLVAAHFISRGLGVRQAVSYVRARRPEVHLTPRQLAALEEFAAGPRKKKAPRRPS